MKTIRGIYFAVPFTEFILYSFESNIDRILYDYGIEYWKGD